MAIINSDYQKYIGENWVEMTEKGGSWKSAKITSIGTLMYNYYYTATFTIPKDGKFQVLSRKYSSGGSMTFVNNDSNSQSISLNTVTPVSKGVLEIKVTYSTRSYLMPKYPDVFVTILYAPN